MTILIIGLVIFLGVHSVRVFADDWRTGMRARSGELAWKGMYSLASLIGFLLIVWGFGLARQESAIIWSPPAAMRHVAALLTIIAFILLAATYVPRNGIKATLHHPMILGVKVWALAHLLANGKLADMVLFGSFLAWAIVCFRAARQRDRAAGTQYRSGTLGGTVISVAVGIAVWAVLAFWLHGILFGVRPFG